MNNDLFKIELFILHLKKLVWSFKLEVQNQKDFYWIVIRLPKSIVIYFVCFVLVYFKKILFIIVYLVTESKDVSISMLAAIMYEIKYV